MKSALKIHYEYSDKRRPDLEPRKWASVWRLLRPYQWIKNSFVFMGLIFSKNLANPQLMLTVALAAVAFCLISSSVYVLNDWFDRERDRLHPEKRFRPLAMGELTSREALIIFSVLIVLGLVLGFLVSLAAGGILVLYLLQNIAYSRGLKNVVVLDVFLLALGFMQRILAGTLGVGIAPSSWLLLCGLMLALFLGFGKRWAELNEFIEESSQQRAVLQNYSPALLDQMMSIAASGVIITYSLYTLDNTTIALHGTSHLIYTVPFVIYGVFRYLYLLHKCGKGGDPSRLVIKDPHIVTVVLLWVTSVIWILTS